MEIGNGVAGVVVDDSSKKALRLWACHSGHAVQCAALRRGQ